MAIVKEMALESGCTIRIHDDDYRDLDEKILAARYARMVEACSKVIYESTLQKLETEDAQA